MARKKATEGFPAEVVVWLEGEDYDEDGNLCVTADTDLSEFITGTRVAKYKLVAGGVIKASFVQDQ